MQKREEEALYLSFYVDSRPFIVLFFFIHYKGSAFKGCCSFQPVNKTGHGFGATDDNAIFFSYHLILFKCFIY